MLHAIQVYQNLLEREDLEEIREGMTEKSVPQSWLCLQLSVSDGKSYRVFSEKHTREAGAGRHWKLI